MIPAVLLKTTRASRDMDIGLYTSKNYTVKNNNYNHVGTILKSNIKIIARGKTDTLNT
jgi:putative N-acetylmannosamine-6-phosphate epimerase